MLHSFITTVHVRRLSSLTIIAFCTGNYGYRCFVAASLKLWNSLPVHPRRLTLTSCWRHFVRILKTWRTVN